MEMGIVVDSRGSEELAKYLLTILDQQQQEAFPSHQSFNQKVSITACSDHSIIGGLTGDIGDESLYVSLLAVDPGYQKCGIGSQLLREVEKVARKYHVRNILLSTRSYQALGFYQKNGFEIYGELADMPFYGVDTYYLVKRLAVKVRR
ncbi:GNAT family N-acetyltransferase [Lapidilactobacillus salsurivasis]